MKESTERQEQELWVLTGWDMTRARVSESSPVEEAESTVEGKLHKSIQQNGRKLEQMWFGAWAEESNTLAESWELSWSGISRDIFLSMQ